MKLFLCVERFTVGSERDANEDTGENIVYKVDYVTRDVNFARRYALTILPGSASGELPPRIKGNKVFSLELEEIKTVL